MGGGGASDELSYQMIDQFDKSIAPTKASQFNANWSAYYQSIYRCNVLLKNIANVNWGTDASLKTQYEAEARFLRAYYYFDLVRLFEKVPLITEPSSAQIPQAEPSATYAQIMTQTERDLVYFESSLRMLKKHTEKRKTNPSLSKNKDFMRITSEWGIKVRDYNISLRNSRLTPEQKKKFEDLNSSFNEL